MRDITVADQAEKSWTEGQTGVLVEAVVKAGGPRSAIADGDLLLAVDGTPVATSRRCRRSWSASPRRKPEAVVLVRRGIRTLFVELQSTWATEAVGR